MTPDNRIRRPALALVTRPSALLLLFTLIFCSGPDTEAQGQRRERDVFSVALARPAAPAAAGAPKTVEDLRARLQEILRSPNLAAAQVAVKAASLDSGRILFEENAGKLLRPASNLKLYTWAAALDRLTPDYRFKTSVYASSSPDNAGVVRGDLIVYGRGDPSLSASFNNGDYNKAIDELAARIAAAGVRKVEGDLVGDESYFSGAPYGSGWEWEDFQWWYGAEVSALSVNDNSVDLFVKPGPSAGAPATITTGPPTPLVSIVNHMTTVERGTSRDLAVYRTLGQNEVEVSGHIPLDDQGYRRSMAISHPALVFVYMLRAALAQRGVTMTGRSRSVDLRERANLSLKTDSLVEVATVLSPPLGLIAARTLKPSQNLYTELVLRALGKAAGGNAKLSSEDAGLEVVRAFLRQAGIDPDTIILTDGSGLSRNDLVTANATLQLLTYMSRHRYAAAFRDALPVAGVDGTLKNRLKRTPAEGNLRAKTGTLSSATSLSGYVTSAAGERLVFSIMANNFPESAETEIRRDTIDAIAVLLASFAGHS